MERFFFTALSNRTYPGVIVLVLNIVLQNIMKNKRNEVKNKNLRDSAIALLSDMGFGTKNLPDAFNWHCAYFWEHFDKNIRNKEGKQHLGDMFQSIETSKVIVKPCFSSSDARKD